MKEIDVFNALLSSDSTKEYSEIIDAYLTENAGEWVPLGGRENNKATVEAGGDPGRSLVERLTNGIDTIIELEHSKHSGIPECRNPKEAGIAWFGIPQEGLSGLSPTQRRILAQKVQIKILAGDGKDARTIEIRDFGLGIPAEKMPTTILSLNESNKVSKFYLAGAYGQGGSSTFASCKYSLIASRPAGSSLVGFTIVKMQIVNWKFANYIYLTTSSRILLAEIDERLFPIGTLVRHIGYDLSNYSLPIGPNSLYGLLNQTLFDPVLPIWLDDHEVHKYRRVIKGVRNALNGSVDEGDESARGPSLSHSVKMFYLNLRDFGRVGIEYWVLAPPTKENKQPNKSFVNPHKPIILTLNGQNHHEISQLLIKRRAELQYLASRMICHVECNNLTLEAKSLLFVSNREGARSGMILDLLENELVQIFQSDDELARLNKEAQQEGFKERDQKTEKEIKLEVSKILKMQGLDVGEGVGAVADVTGVYEEKPVRPRPLRPIPRTIDIKEPPTYVNILWPEDKEITFYPDQRRWLRIETDAGSQYHDATNINLSKINFICGESRSFSVLGSTNLEGGRLRVNLASEIGSTVGDSSVFRIELSRIGLPVLSDQRKLKIIPKPASKPNSQRTALPPFNIIPISQEDEKWNILGWPDDVNRTAYEGRQEEGKLVIYYSTEFPKFSDRQNALERKNEDLAKSFIKRYEIWLVVHGLLVIQSKEQGQSNLSEGPEVDLLEDQENQERLRAATLSIIFADRETRSIRTDSGDDV